MDYLFIHESVHRSVQGVPLGIPKRQKGPARMGVAGFFIVVILCLHHQIGTNPGGEKIFGQRRTTTNNNRWFGEQRRTMTGAFYGMPPGLHRLVMPRRYTAKGYGEMATTCPYAPQGYRGIPGVLLRMAKRCFRMFIPHRPTVPRHRQMVVGFGNLVESIRCM